jgi:hypothetical protein
MREGDYMRSYLNPESNEENGYIRLAQLCSRCAYFASVKLDEADALICQRHSRILTKEEAMSFTCDYFC